MDDVKEINIKNDSQYDPDNIKIDEKLYKYLFVYCIGYVTPKSVKQQDKQEKRVNRRN